MPHLKLKTLGGFLLAAASLVPVSRAQQAREPETVIVTFHAKAGGEAELASVIAKHWASVVQRNMVLRSPHLTLRETEDGNKTYFIEVFTWRDAKIPDTAPEEIKKIWDRMNQLVESRGGKPGLVFDAVSLVR
jgi:hypothetical protein